jgi:hypothetical protein
MFWYLIKDPANAVLPAKSTLSCMSVVKKGVKIVELIRKGMENKNQFFHLLCFLH